VTKFGQETIAPNKPFTFTMNNIMNPPRLTVTGFIVVQTINANGGIIDVGNYEMPKEYFKRGFIKKFTVEPLQLSVGQFPVYYKFTI